MRSTSLKAVLALSALVALGAAQNPQPTPTQAPAAPAPPPLPPNSTWSTYYSTFISTLTPGQPVPTSLPATQSVFTVTTAILTAVPAPVNTSSLAPTSTMSAAPAPTPPTNISALPHSDIPPDDHALPLHIIVDPALGFMGAILILSGAPLAFIGHRSRWYVCACAGFYTVALIVVCFILRFGVANAVNETSRTTKGLFALASICGGAIGSALFVVFQQGGVLISTALGGMAVGLYIQACHAGGLIPVIGLRYILYIGFSSFLFTLACAPKLHSYVLIFTSAHTGITATILGIDCFARVGLKEFYIRNLGFDDLFEKRYPLAFADKRWPLTSAEVIELGMLAGLTLMAMALQTRMWAELRVNLRLMRVQDEERQLQQRAKRAAKEVLADAQRDLREWEKRHGHGDSSDGVTSTTGPQLPPDDGTGTGTQVGSQQDVVRRPSYLERNVISPPPESVRMSSPSPAMLHRQSPIQAFATAPTPWAPPYPPGALGEDVHGIAVTYHPDQDYAPLGQTNDHGHYHSASASQPDLSRYTYQASEPRRASSNPQELDQHEIAEKERLLQELRKIRASIHQELDLTRRTSSANKSMPDINERTEYASPFANSGFARERRELDEARAARRERATTLQADLATESEMRERHEEERKRTLSGPTSDFRQSTPWMVGDRSKTPDEIAKMASTLLSEPVSSHGPIHEPPNPIGLGEWSERDHSFINHNRPFFDAAPGSASQYHTPNASQNPILAETPSQVQHQYDAGTSNYHDTDANFPPPGRSDYEHEQRRRVLSIGESSAGAHAARAPTLADVREESSREQQQQEKSRLREPTLSVSELQDRHNARLKAMQRPLSRHLDEEAAVQKAKDEWERRTALERKKQKAAQKQQKQRNQSDKSMKPKDGKQRQRSGGPPGKDGAGTPEPSGAVAAATDGEDDGLRSAKSTGKSTLAEHLRSQKQQSGAARAREWRESLSAQNTLAQ